MLSTEIPDHTKIEEAFTLIMTTTNDGIRKEADLYLRNLEKNYPYILVSLLQIFQNSQSFLNKQQALLLIKNVIVRNWNKNQIVDGKRICNISDELKNYVKESIVKCLGVIQDDKLKQEINLIIQSIARHDFPVQFQTLENYFIQGLQTISQSGAITGALCYDLIVTLKCVEQEVTKSRLASFKGQQNQFVQKIWNNLIFLWQSVTKLQEQPNNCSTLINKLSKKLDRLLSLAVTSFHSEHDQEKIQYIFMLLLEKSAFLLNSVQQQKLLQSNIKTIVHSLGNIQSVFSLSCVSGLKDYLTLLKLIIIGEWEDKRIIRCGLIGLMKVLKTFFYHCNDDQCLKSFSTQRSQALLQLKQQATLVYNSYFTENMQQLIEVLIRIAAIPNDLSDEDLIEQEEELTIDDAKSEMHCPIYTLCLLCEEQLLLRFPDLFIKQVVNIMDTLIQTNFKNVGSQILESFFALLGQAPKVTLKLRMNPIPIQPVLQYLITANTIQSQRRFAFLCRNYCGCFTQAELPQVLEFLLTLINNSQDQIVQYQSLMCIKNVISVPEMGFDFTNIKFFEQIAPVIVKLLCNLQKSNILWPLLQLLEKLIQKYSEKNKNTIEGLIQIIEKADLGKLMITKSTLLVDAICEMFQTLFVSFPLGTNLGHLYKLALILVDANIDSNESRIIDFFLFLLLEYDLQSDNGTTGILFRNVFLTHENTLFENTDLQNMQTVLKIVEELILLNQIPLSQSLLGLIEKKIQIAQQIESDDNSVSIKNSCLSLLETIIIRQYDTLDVGQYSQIIVFLIQELVKINQKDKMDKMFYDIHYINHIVSLMNRFIIKDIVTVIKVINQVQCTFDQYFTCWFKESQHFQSRGNRKINVIAFLLSLKYLQRTTFQQHFQSLLSEIFPELDYDNDLRNPEFRLQQQQNRLKLANAKQTRHSNPYRHSFRKEVLQDMCLYDEQLNLKQFFFQQIQESMKTHCFEVGQLIHDTSVMDKLKLLFNE